MLSIWNCYFTLCLNCLNHQVPLSPLICMLGRLVQQYGHIILIGRHRVYLPQLEELTMALCSAKQCEVVIEKNGGMSVDLLTMAS